MAVNGAKRTQKSKPTLLIRFGSSIALMALGALLISEAILQSLFAKPVLFIGVQPVFEFSVGTAVVFAGSVVKGWKE